jgi:outer membrane protein W
LIELTARNSIGSQLNYGISSTQRAEVNLPQWSYMASIKMVKDVSYGTSKESSPAFGSMFFAVGPSSAWSVGSTSSYFENIRPAFGSQLNPALFPDVGFGYELGDSRMFFNLAYRPMRSSTSAYGISFQAKRQSLLFEVCKLLLNYHGFQPFIGVSINKEWLSYQEAQNGTTTQSIYNSTFTGGMTLGWDIRLKEKPWWILRTNLRYTPPLQIQMDSQNSMSFQNLEFNFIQIVFLPRYLRRSSI